MALEPGTHFGSYEIAESIGAGGMGEVWRARDMKLEREVAIKVLPESFASDADRVARFEQEAKTLASLNHANIAQIHGLERTDGTTAIVMELIPGPTLADRIGEGALPADEAMNIAMQIAEALEAAHEKGIVHRDLKPANIKLRPDGTVKVLDFGIAKAFEPGVISSGGQSPVMTTPVTQSGVILGTAAYMSPEQARGKEVDDRTDIWAFGCVLYEMLTGQPVFGGEDVTITLARVLERDIHMDALAGNISPAIKQTIRLCLEKDVSKRVSDIRDVRHLLEGRIELAGEGSEAVTASASPLWLKLLPLGTALVAALVVWFVTVKEPVPEEPESVIRFIHLIPDGQDLMVASQRNLIAISPDGTRFLYSTGQGVFIRELGDIEARLIPGTSGVVGLGPVFSPDGQSIVFWRIADATLNRISITGGTAVTIAQIPFNPFLLHWTPDNSILYGSSDGIYQVSANGGTPELIIPTGDEVTGAGSPKLLPDGDTIIYSAIISDATIMAHSLSTGESKELISGGRNAQYVPSGHLVYAIGNDLFAVSFDLETLTVTGGAVPLVQNVFAVGTLLNYDISENGTLVYITGGEVALELRSLKWVTQAGEERLLPGEPMAYGGFLLSPDDQRLAVGINGDIWIRDLAREGLSRMTTEASQDAYPLWTPDGSQIIFTSDRDGGGLFIKAWNGTGETVRLTTSPEPNRQHYPETISPDGQYVVFTEGQPFGSDLMLLDMESGETSPLIAEPVFDEDLANISPDGNWIAYESDETGLTQIYVRPFPNVNDNKWLLSSGEGHTPVWSEDSSEIYYLEVEVPGPMLATAVETEPEFTVGETRLVFERTIPQVASQPQPAIRYNLRGDEFLVMDTPGGVNDQAPEERPEIVVVTNWMQELRRLSPSNE